MTAPQDPHAQLPGARPAGAQLPGGRLDPALDPDRTLPELLSERTVDEDRPSPYVFLLGLAGIAAFLLLVAFVFSHLSP